ncbi:MAG: hypothetical protein LBO03_08930 [Acidaminococcales bacterium]|nr:hypothetical protein [Acidaminococcales bacterium]
MENVAIDVLAMPFLLDNGVICMYYGENAADNRVNVKRQNENGRRAAAGNKIVENVTCCLFLSPANTGVTVFLFCLFARGPFPLERSRTALQAACERTSGNIFYNCVTRWIYRRFGHIRKGFGRR